MPGLLDASYYNDALVALPHSRSVPVLYYNKDRFKEAGLDENQPPVTWDDLKEQSKKADGRRNLRIFLSSGPVVLHGPGDERGRYDL